MRNSLLLILPVLLLGLSSSGCAPKFQKVEDLAALKEMFLKFRSALRDNAGKEAVQYLSQNSLDRYEQFQNLAVSSSPAELKQLSVVEQVEVARLLRCFTKSELKSMSQREVVAGLINQDRLDAPFLKDATLGEPVFQGKKGYIQIFDKSGPVKEKLTFVKEENDWKIDLAALEDIHEKIYSGMIRKRGLTSDELVETIKESWNSEETPATDSPLIDPEIPTVEEN